MAKELTDRQKALIDALQGEAEGDIRTAMRIAGYSENTTINEAVEPIKDQLISAATTMLAINAPRAAGGLIGVLGNPTSAGAKEKMTAATQILDRVGVVKTERMEVKAEGSAVVLLPPKGGTE